MLLLLGEVLLLMLHVFAHQMSPFLVSTHMVTYLLAGQRGLYDITSRHCLLGYGGILQVLKRLVQALDLLRLWHEVGFTGAISC